MYDSILAWLKLICFCFSLFFLSKDGWTALIAACKEGHFDVVKELLESGAKVQLPDLVNSYNILFRPVRVHCSIISLWQDLLKYYLEVVVLSIRPFHLVSHSPIDEILKVISAGISCVWNITKGYVKNMAYIWSGGWGLVCWNLQLMLSVGRGEVWLLHGIAHKRSHKIKPHSAVVSVTVCCV